MTLREIHARMKALVQKANACLPDFDSSEQSKAREAREKHSAALDEFDALERSALALKATAQDASSAGDAQFDGLMQRGSIAAIVTAVVEQRALDGAEREIQAEMGLGENQVPLEMLEQRSVTPAPTESSASQASVVQPVFASGDAAFLRVPQRRVRVGDATFPVLTSRPTVGGPHKDSSVVAETTGAFTAASLSPGRLQASFFWLRTDAARFAGMDAALRAALNSSLSEALDATLLTQLVADVTRVNAAAVNTFATYRSALVYGNIDGRYAATEADLRILVGSKTLAHASTKYRGNTADDSAVDSLRRITSGLRVSPHVAAVSGNKQDTIVRKGGRPDAVIALWPSVSLIRDEISKASTGEIKLTAILLAALAVTRADGFARVQVQHA